MGIVPACGASADRRSAAIYGLLRFRISVQFRILLTAISGLSRPLMSDIHTIRLRGPWQMEPLAATSADGRGQGAPDASRPELPPAARVKLPIARAAVLPVDFFGRVRFVRRFQRPTGLEPHETVRLVLDTPWTVGIVTLNERPLESETTDGARSEWNITERLADANVVMVELEYRPDDAPPADAPLLGEVWLEIVGV